MPLLFTAGAARATADGGKLEKRPASGAPPPQPQPPPPPLQYPSTQAAAAAAASYFPAFSEPVSTMARHASTSFDTGIGLGLQQRYPPRPHPQHHKPPPSPPQQQLALHHLQPGVAQYHHHQQQLLMAAHQARAHQARMQPVKPAAQYPRPGAFHPNTMFHQPVPHPAYRLPLNTISQASPLAAQESAGSRRMLGPLLQGTLVNGMQPHRHHRVSSRSRNDNLHLSESGNSAGEQKQLESMKHCAQENVRREMAQHHNRILFEKLKMQGAADSAQTMHQALFPKEAAVSSSASNSIHPSSPTQAVNSGSYHLTSLPPLRPQSQGSLLPSTSATGQSPSLSVGSKRLASPHEDELPRKRVGLPPLAWKLRIPGSTRQVEVPKALIQNTKSGDSAVITTKPIMAHSSSMISAPTDSAAITTNSGSRLEESPIDLSVGKRKTPDNQRVTPESTNCSQDSGTSQSLQSVTELSQPQHIVSEQDARQSASATYEHSRLRHHLMSMPNTTQNPTVSSHDARLKEPVSCIQSMLAPNSGGLQTYPSSFRRSSAPLESPLEVSSHRTLNVPVGIPIPSPSGIQRFNMNPEQVYGASGVPLEAMQYSHHREPHTGSAAVVSSVQSRSFLNQQMSPTAAITPEMPSAANGPQGRIATSSSYRCVNCSADAKFMCSACQSARYCSSTCQIQHWDHHNVLCRRLRNQSRF